MAREEAGGRSLAERAHDLYWNSDRGVNAIADDLGLSKGGLYELVQPLSSEKPCAECGTEMVFATRTARERGWSTCPFCGAGEEEEDPEEEKGRPPPAVRIPEGPFAGTSSRPLTGTSSRPLSGDRARILGGVLIGVAGVILLFRHLRR
ncbi:MAG: hypothetical protein EXR92_01245 [Gemmatimonadetes bacterium]|nr:hypothetical protein [Gemmatimonadota bacterium]